MLLRKAGRKSRRHGNYISTICDSNQVQEVSKATGIAGLRSSHFENSFHLFIAAVLPGPSLVRRARTIGALEDLQQLSLVLICRLVWAK